MSTTPDLDAIERAAKGATPGPWRSVASAVEHSRKYRCLVFGGRDEMYDTSALLAADARYLALLDPATVLWLVERARRAEEAELALREIGTRWCEEVGGCPETMHNEGCPEDDTCDCPHVVTFNRICKERAP